MKGGVQLVSVTPNTTSPIPVQHFSRRVTFFLMQLASISYVTQALFLATVTTENNIDSMPAGQPSFLDINGDPSLRDPVYTSGDVLKGIEQMSHNALISLIVSVVLMVKNHTGDITTSFWDTVILTRSVDGDVSSEEKLRLRAAEDGKLKYILE